MTGGLAANNPQDQRLATTQIRNLIRTIPDFPKPGIMFRDVSTLFNDGWGLDLTVRALAELFHGTAIDKVVGIEARGFAIGAPLAIQLKTGFVMARKRGKLPGPVEECHYDLEYGTDCIQIHRDAIGRGQRCLIVDDLLATGGTAGATATLVEKLGGVVAGIGFIVNLPELGGVEKLARYQVKWLVDFAGH